MIIFGETPVKVYWFKKKLSLNLLLLFIVFFAEPKLQFAQQNNINHFNIGFDIGKTIYGAANNFLLVDAYASHLIKKDLFLNAKVYLLKNNKYETNSYTNQLINNTFTGNIGIVRRFYNKRNLPFFDFGINAFLVNINFKKNTNSIVYKDEPLFTKKVLSYYIPGLETELGYFLNISKQINLRATYNFMLTYSENTNSYLFTKQIIPSLGISSYRSEFKIHHGFAMYLCYRFIKN